MVGLCCCAGRAGLLSHGVQAAPAAGQGPGLSAFSLALWQPLIFPVSVVLPFPDVPQSLLSPADALSFTASVTVRTHSGAQGRGSGPRAVLALWGHRDGAGAEPLRGTVCYPQGRGSGPHAVLALWGHRDGAGAETLRGTVCYPQGRAVEVFPSLQQGPWTVCWGMSRGQGRPPVWRVFLAAPRCAQSRRTGGRNRSVVRGTLAF